MVPAQFRNVQAMGWKVSTMFYSSPFFKYLLVTFLTSSTCFNHLQRWEDLETLMGTNWKKHFDSWEEGVMLLLPTIMQCVSLSGRPCWHSRPPITTAWHSIAGPLLHPLCPSSEPIIGQLHQLIITATHFEFYTLLLFHVQCCATYLSTMKMIWCWTCLEWDSFELHTSNDDVDLFCYLAMSSASKVHF